MEARDGFRGLVGGYDLERGMRGVRCFPWYGDGGVEDAGWMGLLGAGFFLRLMALNER
ncbi:MAG: hypothetical protein ACTSWP_02895 [Candidatus Freyarchaeota archaeon]